MTNHVHLVVLPHERRALARVIGVAHQRHAARLNRRADRTGHLWQSRYFSTLLDEHHLWAAVRYIERNPVRAGLVAKAELYPWSSARAHCLGRANPFLSPSRPFPGPVENWATWLEQDRGDVMPVTVLRQNSRTGWPTGSTEFVTRVADQQP